ncbi:Ivy family c-type lysozyme inhibitor [Rhizobium halophytocola]|uniref:Inhibitor of vertebrate lysozyme (Ivy) n=1 Tax=Rhizobium halophytocola TaxID=735519 RepID=A0ABS4DX78_9HYPH|nr:Ivy family c-type lysozyme inhibitor [Rhizobium halophytocola]MBP1850270.1 hypothetical protein [Rhizobium halophytocola]
MRRASFQLGLGLVLTFAALAVHAAEPTLGGRFLPQVVATSKPHHDSLEKLIRGRAGIPTWVRNMLYRDRYVALASVPVDLGKERHERFDACEAGRCAASRIVVLYSGDGKHAAMVVEDIKLGEVFLGDPSAAEKKVLSAPVR